MSCGYTLYIGFRENQRAREGSSENCTLKESEGLRKGMSINALCRSLQCGSVGKQGMARRAAWLEQWTLL